MTVELPTVQTIGDYAPLPYAARVSQVNERTLQRAIARGDVHAVRLDGRTVLVSLASARAYTPQRRRSSRRSKQHADISQVRNETEV